MNLTIKNACVSRQKWILALFFSLFIGLFFSPLQAQIDFTKSNLNFNGFGSAPITTSLTFGPDGRLYVLEYPGTIYALTVKRNASDNYEVIAKETITGVKSIPNHDDDGTTCSGPSGSCNSRESTGLAVSGTAKNPILYVTSSDYRVGSGSNGGFGDVNLDTNSGVITQLTWNGISWDVIDLVRGLPRSEENHATNGLEFTTINGIDYLIVAQGGHANGGAASVNFSYLCEYALSGAILSVNLSALEKMPVLNDNGRNYIYNLPTLDDPTRANVNGITDPNNPSYNGVDINDPWGGNDGLNQAIVVPGGPVQIFSPGYRNPYDLVVTESGAVYTTDNGANGGWGGIPVNEGSATVTNAYDANEPGSDSSSSADDGEFMNNTDHLQLITTNKDNYNFGSFYGGHPNPIRANPTGAGLYTAPANLGTVGAVFRTQKYDPNSSTPGSTADVNIALPANWPPVQTANSVEGDWRGPGISNPDGPDDDPITTWGTNTNGIDEYTASNFGGAMKGDLLAGSSRGILRRVELKADGTLKKFTPEFLGGIGGNALGVTCNGDSEIFPGTIWAGTLNGKIVVYEPMEGEALNFPLRINAGGPEVSLNGNLFGADNYFFNGQSYTNTSTKIPELYQTERFDSKLNLDYKIPVPSGNYQVVLHFAEIYWGAAGGVAGGIGKRVFDVNIEDVLVLDDYDIIADVGSETPVEKTFLVTVSDGELNLNFSALASTGGINSPKVSAIEILTDSNESPVAIASAEIINGTVPLNVTFTGDNSTDDIEVISYLWDFKDGSTSSSANPKHTFTSAGIYEVELTVQDSEELTNSTTLTITVVDNQNQATVSGINASPDNGTAPLLVSFTVLNGVDDVATTSYLWDFGDGSTSSSEMEPSHVFSEKGTYEVSLTVNDEQGLSHTQTTTVTVIDEKKEEETIVGILMKNPVKEVAQVRIIDNGTDMVKVFKIYLHDSSGRIVGIYNAKDIVSNGLYQIPIASLSTGQIYYLSFEMDKGKRLVFSMLVDN